MTIDSGQALYNALQKGDMQTVAAAFEGGTNATEARDAATGRTILFAIIDRMSLIPDDSDEFGQLTMIFINAVTFGLNPNLAGKDGITPLNYSLQKENYLVPDLLLGTGAKTDEKFPQGGDTATHVAVRLALEGKGIRLLNSLLALGADPTIKNDAGVSAYDLVGRIESKPEDEQKVQQMLSHSPQVKALVASARDAEQQKLRDKSKRFKLGPQ